MTRRPAWALLACALAATPAVAQQSGRTDGPEGSEIGKGGYDPLSGNGRFGIAAQWGAALHEDLPGHGAPLYAGGSLTWWGIDWFALEAQGGWDFYAKRANALIGPRFRTVGYPVGLSLGLLAGAIIPKDGETRFALSPQAGLEFEFARRAIFGLRYALDWPVGEDHGLGHRIFLELGFKL